MSSVNYKMTSMSIWWPWFIFKGNLYYLAMIWNELLILIHNKCQGGHPRGIEILVRGKIFSANHVNDYPLNYLLLCLKWNNRVFVIHKERATTVVWRGRETETVEVKRVWLQHCVALVAVPYDRSATVIQIAGESLL